MKEAGEGGSGVFAWLGRLRCAAVCLKRFRKGWWPWRGRLVGTPGFSGIALEEGGERGGGPGMFAWMVRLGLARFRSKRLVTGVV